jgi:hypothetical protein
MLQNYEEIFKEPQGLPPNRQRNHRIVLQAGSSPVNVRPYRYPHYQKNEIESIVTSLLQSGVIRPSMSPYSSPVVLVKKHDGSWRLCVDYHALNHVTVKDKFPIPVHQILKKKLIRHPRQRWLSLKSKRVGASNLGRVSGGGASQQINLE